MCAAFAPNKRLRMTFDHTSLWKWKIINTLRLEQLHGVHLPGLWFRGIAWPSQVHLEISSNVKATITFHWDRENVWEEPPTDMICPEVVVDIDGEVHGHQNLGQYHNRLFLGININDADSTRVAGGAFLPTNYNFTLQPISKQCRLEFDNSRSWGVNGSREPHIYTAELSIRDDAGHTVDKATVRFGVRQ